ncbi:MAG: hypothetical protein K2L64_02305 [Ureaplasma sp.]|nr:hypothetical protein [Ureaplasma sp.]
MKKKSKILSIFFGTLLTSVLIGTTSILASCKNESDIDDNKPSTSIPEQPKPDLSTDPLTIKFINLDSLYDTVKDYILRTPRMYTTEEFVNDIKNNEQSVKDLIANKLYISNKETLDVNKKY